MRCRHVGPRQRGAGLQVLNAASYSQGVKLPDSARRKDFVPSSTIVEYVVHRIRDLLTPNPKMVKKEAGPQRPKRKQLPQRPEVRSSQVVEAARKRGIAEEHILNLQAMMDPGEFSSGTTTFPARSPWLRSVTTESTTLKLSQADGSVSASGAFAVEVKARPDAALSVLSNVTDIEDNLPINGSFSEKMVASGDYIRTVGLSHGQVAAGAILGTAAGLPVWVVPLVSTVGNSRIVTISESSISCNVVARCFTGPLAALVASGTATVRVAQGASGSATLAIPAACTYIGFTYHEFPAFSLGWKLVANVSLSYNGGAGGAALGTAARIYPLQTLENVDELRAFRVVGQSVLLTYTGSQINNGGEIAIARVFSSWTPDPSLGLYQSILKLPKSRRYVGRVAAGAHCFWMPATVDDVEPRLYGTSYDSIRPSYKIVAAGALDDPTESILCQLSTTVEFSTDAPSYASVDYAPPWNSFDVALQLLALFNPNGENPTHTKRIAKFAVRKVKQGLQYAIDNPAEAAATLAKLGALLMA